MPRFNPDDCGVGSIIGAQLGKNALDSTLDGLLGDRKLIRDLLVADHPLLAWFADTTAFVVHARSIPVG
jgi:hypothetical protein